MADVDEKLRQRLAHLVVRVASEPCGLVAREMALGLPVGLPCPTRSVSLPCVSCEARALEAALGEWMREAAP